MRWAALLAEGRKTKGTAAHQLASWIARAQGDELQRACLTGVHAAGATKTSLAALLSAEGKSARTCLAKEPELRGVLWIDL